MLLRALQIVLLVSLVSCGSPPESDKTPSSAIPPTPSELTIGVFLPLTGQMAPYGVNAENGLTLAQEEINASGGIRGRQVQLDIVDDRGEQISTLNAVKLLVEQKGANILIGGLTSSGTLDAAAYAKEKQVLLFSPAASHPDIPKTGDPFFVRNWQSDALAGNAAANFAAESLAARKAAILYVDNAYGQGQRTAFRAEFEKNGGNIVIQRGFPQDDYSTLPSLLAAIKAAEADVVFLPAYPKDYEEILRKAANIKLETPRIATDTFEDPALIAAVGDKAEGLYYVVAGSPGPDYAPRADFVAKYRARFKDASGAPMDPGLVSDTAYDALHLVAIADETAGTDDPSRVRAALLAIHDYRGAAGPTSFTSDGDIIKPIVVKVIRDGKVVVPNPPSP